MRRLKIVLAAVGGFLLLVIILQNTAVVTTRILWLEFDLPRALLLFLCLIAGFGIGYLTRTLRRRQAAQTP
jgi:uncharacterized integral membrane protein